MIWIYLTWNFQKCHWCLQFVHIFCETLPNQFYHTKNSHSTDIFSLRSSCFLMANTSTFTSPKTVPESCPHSVWSIYRNYWVLHILPEMRPPEYHIHDWRAGGRPPRSEADEYRKGLWHPGADWFYSQIRIKNITTSTHPIHQTTGYWHKYFWSHRPR